MEKKPTKAELKKQLINASEKDIEELIYALTKEEAKTVNDALSNASESLILKFVPAMLFKQDDNHYIPIRSYKNGLLVKTYKDEVPSLYFRKHGDPFHYELLMRGKEIFPDVSPMLESALNGVTEVYLLENKLLALNNKDGRYIVGRDSIPYGIGGPWHTQKFFLITPLADGLVLKRIGGKTKYEEEFVTIKPDLSLNFRNYAFYKK